MSRLPSLRASDSDREHVAERLRHATAEGRLSTTELEQRLEALYAARTYGELDALVADLPLSRVPGQSRFRVIVWAGAAGVAAFLLAVLGLLAVARRHYVAVAAGSRHLRPFRFPGSLPEPHHGVVVMPSAVGMFVILVICAALIWLLLRSRATSDG